MESKGSRVLIVDEQTGLSRTKSAAQIVKENELFAQKLRGKEMSKSDEQLKEAIRLNDLGSVVKSDKSTAVSESHVNDDDDGVVLDKRSMAKEGEASMVKTVAAKRHVSLKFGVVGSGQAGGRIAEVFNRYGYDVCAINTASQDLEFLDIEEDRKYLIANKELGGAGRDLDIGAACFEEDADAIRNFINEKMADAEALILAVSGGGGTGSGSAELLVGMLAEMGKPILVVYILPGSFDDSQSKHNSVVTLSRLAGLAANNIINSLVLVDNANIELAFPNLSQAAFWETANNAVVEPLHMFNSVSATPTNFDALDSMDFAKSLIEAGNCVVFGTNKVPKERYEGDETALMSSIMEGLEGGLLASGFDLKEAQTVGVLVTARQSVLETIPHTSISYVFKYIADEFDSAKSFKGIYAVPSQDEDITIRFIFSGMGLPKDRVESLKNEAKKHMETLEAKKKTTKMVLDLGKDKTTTKVDDMISRMKKKNTGIGKLLGNVKKIERKR